MRALVPEELDHLDLARRRRGRGLLQADEVRAFGGPGRLGGRAQGEGAEAGGGEAEREVASIECHGGESSVEPEPAPNRRRRRRASPWPRPRLPSSRTGRRGP